MTAFELNHGGLHFSVFLLLTQMGSVGMQPYLNNRLGCKGGEMSTRLVLDGRRCEG